MKILVTGAAGFIGYHLCKNLVEKNISIVGVDNINDYYETDLKIDRLVDLGFEKSDLQFYNKSCISSKFKNLNFIKIDITDTENLRNLFSTSKFNVVCNLAAQAGVRYSLKNPLSYIDSNIVGFTNILENCKDYNIEHLIYASSSSVYGESSEVPFNVNQNVDYPISLYAATKKSNELLAHSYTHIYNLRTTGLRFFTVYGEFGRPDMAYFLFAKAILNNKPIKVFNQGKMKRDFTYISDIVNGISLTISFFKNNYDTPLYNIFNIGNGNSVSLLNFINQIEKNFKTEIKKEFLPIQPGDVTQTWADISDLKKIGYKSSVGIDEGVKFFCDWFKNYYKFKF